MAFVLCLAVVLCAMGWISVKALRLEQAEMEARRHEALALADAKEARRKEAQARRETQLEQDVRLALWRMDSALAPLVARESARSYLVYRTFLPAGGPYGLMPGARPAPGGLATSPLVSEVSPHILVHFQFEPDGRLTSPRVPEPTQRHLVVPQYISREAVAEAEAQLARVAAAVTRDRLAAMLPEKTFEPAPVFIVPPLEIAQQAQAQPQGQAEAPYPNERQRRARDVAEYNLRSQAFKQSANVFLSNQGAMQPLDAPVAPTELGEALMTPLWVEAKGNEASSPPAPLLILARRISVGKQEYVQGCLLNWPVIKEGLLSAVADLLPEADLEPVDPLPAEDESCLLAALPVRLIPGRRIEEDSFPGPVAADLSSLQESALLLPRSSTGPNSAADGALSPIRLSLMIAWACVSLAAVAVAALLAGVIRLSERRAAFVSAVTHELRTPLTTFHMYTEMLAEGMVPGEEQQQSYLSTLRSEASRLSHLVENVLAYARLERGRIDGRTQDLTLDKLLEPIHHRLADRARQDGMELLLEGDPAARRTVVRANPSAVEQILLNLVDNAGKYAAAASDKRVHLRADRKQSTVELRVRDHGPGVAAKAQGRLFRSFSKSAREAAHSAPGVGLGLALSRRLARDMGGRLRLDKSVTEGACFVLSLAAGDRPSAP
jgi:signal transduction histidine kinase